MSTASSSGAWKSADVVSDQFPVGLRVLVVDDDPTCLMILKKMLRTCLYEAKDRFTKKQNPNCQQKELQFRATRTPMLGISSYFVAGGNWGCDFGNNWEKIGMLEWNEIFRPLA
ncbi:unnamed protein product [Prunus armeniaca]